jgi:CIC family chloride channel protein
MATTSPLGEIAARAERRGAPRLALAVLIGVLGAAGNVVFQWAIAKSTTLFNMVGAPYGRLGIPLTLVAGGVALLALNRIAGGDVLGYGFPRFLEMLHLHGGRVRRRWIVLKTLGAAISLGAGAAVGREGPIAQIGGSIGGLIARWVRAAGDDRKVLVACGTAAGIAATFNAPIAGVLFAQEIVLLGEAQLTHLSLVIVSAATAVATTGQLLGAEPVLRVSPFELASYWQCTTYAGLGVVLGVLGPLYTWGFHGLLQRLQRFAVPTPVRLLGGLFLVGLLAMCVPKNLADGYPVINEALAGTTVWHVALVLAAAKFTGSILSLSSGAPGGVFGPVFFIGAMTGAAYHAGAATLLPRLTGDAGSYALVGLAGFLAATTHAPLTALFIVLEMTQSYAMTVPALLTVGLALIVSQRLEGESIDTYGLHAEGKHLHGDTLPQLLDDLPIGKAFRANVPTVREDLPLPAILRLVSEGELVGVLSFASLREVLLEDSLGSLVVAADLCRTNAPAVTPTTSLGEGFRLIEGARLDEIPVVDPAAPRHLLGMLSRADLITAYNRAVGSLGALPLDAWLGDNDTSWSHDYRVITIPIPAPWIGRSLRGIDPRGRLGVTALAVRPAGALGADWAVPDPDRNFVLGDMVVLAGTLDRLRAVRAG